MDRHSALFAYIKSQENEGWVCLPDRYDDGGYTGGNMERPALKALIRDIEDGKVDCVVAAQVRGTFELYLECQSIIQTIKAIDRRGWLPPRCEVNRPNIH